MSKYLAWLPKSFPDFVAGVLVIAGLIILSLGIDGEVKTLIGIGSAWLFGRTWQEGSKARGPK